MRITSDVRPGPRTNGSVCSRSLPSTSHGNEMTLLALSYSAMYDERASNSVLIRSPTSSMIAAKSSCSASAAPISLMTASSAARWSVSARSRFVSPKSRAFSSATPMLEASVVRSRSSASLYA